MIYHHRNSAHCARSAILAAQIAWAASPTDTKIPTMKLYFGLRGPRLRFAVLMLVVSPAFLCYGYNQAVAGGLLTLETFVETFPAMDTVNTTGSQRTNNANIQGSWLPVFLETKLILQALLWHCT